MRASRNALRHGLTAENFVSSKESAEDLEALYGMYVAEFEPEGLIEERLVRQMALADWRSQRALKAETECGFPEGRTVTPKGDLALIMEPYVVGPDDPRFELMTRYAGRAEREWERALAMLKDLQRERGKVSGGTSPEIFAIHDPADLPQAIDKIMNDLTTGRIDVREANRILAMFERYRGLLKQRGANEGSASRSHRLLGEGDGQVPTNTDRSEEQD